MNWLSLRIATMLAMIITTWAVPVHVVRGQTTPSDALKTRGVDRLEQTMEPPRGARRMALCIGIDHYQSETYSPLT